MKKIKITENELIAMIEKIVNEQATGVAFGGFGENMGFSKPTDKYEELNLEVTEDEVVEDEVSESEIVERLRKRMGPRKFPEKVNEQAERRLSDLSHKLMQYKDDEGCCGNLAILVDRYNGLLRKHDGDVPFHAVVDELVMIMDKSR